MNLQEALDRIKKLECQIGEIQELADKVIAQKESGEFTSGKKAVAFAVDRILNKASRVQNEPLRSGS